ncbi:unnamed protein product, partial [marine sediment metagenome]
RRLSGKNRHYFGTQKEEKGAEMQDYYIGLENGRMLGYRFYGDPKGVPVFYVHGGGGSRIFAAALHKAALEAGVNLIAADRPGMGISDYQADRSILDWADDMAALADHLMLDGFSVLSESGGSPFALATAYALPDRVPKVALVSASSPTDAPGVIEAMQPTGRSLIKMMKIFPNFLL